MSALFIVGCRDETFLHLSSSQLLSCGMLTQAAIIVKIIWHCQFTGIVAVNKIIKRGAASKPAEQLPVGCACRGGVTMSVILRGMYKLLLPASHRQQHARAFGPSIQLASARVQLQHPQSEGLGSTLR